MSPVPPGTLVTVSQGGCCSQHDGLTGTVIAVGNPNPDPALQAAMAVSPELVVEVQFGQAPTLLYAWRELTPASI